MQSPKRSRSAPNTTGPTVLVVDDMPIALSVISEMLTSHGIRVLAACNGPLEGLEALRNGIAPQVIVSDFDMPDMNGEQFLDTACALIPGAVGIIMSGKASEIRETPIPYPIIEKGSPDFSDSLLTAIHTAARSTMPT